MHRLQAFGGKRPATGFLAAWNPNAGESYQVDQSLAAGAVTQPGESVRVASEKAGR
jgi:hypothetical protein